MRLARLASHVALGCLVAVGACGDDGPGPTGGGGDTSSTGSPSTTASTAGSGGGGGAANTSVTGKLIGYDEQPLAGDTVTIGGVAVTTDAAGAFSFADVVRPYTLRVVDGASGVTDYIGLRSEHPIVQVGTYFTGGTAFAQLNGSISGSSVPLVGHDRLLVGFSAPLHGVVQQERRTGTGDTFDFETSLLAPPEPVHIVALSWTPDPTTHEPATFLEFGALDVSAQAGDVLTPELALSPVGTKHLTIDVTVDGDQIFHGFGGFVTMGEGFVPLPSPGYPAAHLDIPTPDAPGAKAGVVGYFDEGEGADKTESLSFIQGLPLDGSAALASHPSTHITSPADAAHGSMVGTELVWSAPAGQVNVVRLSADSKPGYAAVTTDGSVTIPDLSTLGITFEAGDEVTWTVVGYGPYDTLDAAVERGAIVREERTIDRAAGRGPVFADGFVSKPAARTFVEE